MLITINNTYTSISKHFNSLPQQTQNKIIKEFSYKKKIGYFRYEEIYLFRKRKTADLNQYYLIPTGLLIKLIRTFMENGIKYEIIDKRNKFNPEISIDEFYEKMKSIDNTIENRDYQREAIEIALKRIRGVIHHATASGKTITMAGIIYCLNVKTLVLCLGIDHVEQIVDDLRKYTGRRVSVVSGGDYSTSGDIVVSNVQALHAVKKRSNTKFIELMKEFKCLIVDEAHLSGITWKEVIYHCTNAYYRIGFTGTFYREDGAIMELIGEIGPVLSRINYTYLTENKFISNARFFIVDPMCEEIDLDQDIWPNCLDQAIINNDKRNNLIKKICDKYTEKGHQVLIISPLRVEHGYILNKLIPASVYLSGNSERFFRKSELNKFRDKNNKVIICSRIFDQAINIPDLNCIILAGGGKAHNAIYQRIGRGIRRTVDKNRVDIIIFWDSHSKILLEHSRRIKSLILKEEVWKNNVKHLGKFRKMYEDEEFSI